MDVALVTYSELLDLFPDDRPLRDALRGAGLEVGIVSWDDPEFDWATPRLTFLRSPWDYYRRPDEFLAWAEHAASRTELVNPLAVVRWNLHKSYLVGLAERGLPVVPTTLLRRGTVVSYRELVAGRGWSRAIVKPAISADSWETHAVAAGDATTGQSLLDRLLPEHDLLVQPFLESVETYGERCLVFLDGAFSHAVRKNALTRGGRWTDLPEGVPVEAAGDEIELAQRIVAAAGLEGCLYARVDLTRDDQGAPLLLELEATEPTLFLEDSPSGLARLTAALVARSRAPRALDPTNPRSALL